MDEKLFFLDQHGCAKNQVDGELIISELASIGWKRTDEAEKASLIVINSCGFINSAKEDSLNSLFQARNSFPNAKILLAGCLAERYANDFSESLPEADFIFGNGDISKIKDAVNSIFNENDESRTLLCPQNGISNGERIEFLNLPGSAYVKITEGCDNVCSFCAIPLIRGNLRSRPVSDIVNEIQSLLDRGIFEFNLIGQDLASYGLGEGEGEEYGNLSGATFEKCVSGSVNLNGGKSPLYHLLEKISALKGDFWVRLLYIHPDNFPLDILEVIKKDRRILPYFDIPFQSGDDSVILSMNRHGSSQKYISLINNIRCECEQSFYKDCAIRTTFLCGFPGETDKNAVNTQNFVKEIKSDWAGCFAYSREENTPAYSMKNQVSERKSKKRCEVLEEIQSQIMSKNLTRHVGKTYRLLIEEIVEKSEEEASDTELEGIAIARAWFQAPEVDGSVVLYYDLENESEVKAIQCGKTVTAQICGVSGVDLFARYIGD
ncbi:MAG: MiaB/RimO family radical SAM methylthiotransferase [Treponemataceae bacterium]|nr:MiaB/RimO family radical SAM methylthiotransferase [Treponemataceae bacterium]